VRQRVRAHAARHFDLAPRDQRASHRRAEQVFAIVDRTSAQRGKNEIVHELETQIFDEALLRSGRDRLFPNTLQLGLTLANISGDADDARVVVLAQPRDDDGCVESA
jgi:hypothetical protein